jgi:glycogen debranching enzyme
MDHDGLLASGEPGVQLTWMDAKIGDWVAPCGRGSSDHSRSCTSAHTATLPTARSFLLPVADHVADYGVGSIAEIFEGDPPFRPAGCIAQAWSVAETLGAWHELARAR